MSHYLFSYSGTKTPMPNISHYTKRFDGTVIFFCRNIHLTNKRVPCHLCSYKATSKKDVDKHVKSVHTREKDLRRVFLPHRSTFSGRF